jgi:hypothetical protein
MAKMAKMKKRKRGTMASNGQHEVGTTESVSYVVNIVKYDYILRFAVQIVVGSGAATWISSMVTKESLRDLEVACH